VRLIVSLVSANSLDIHIDLLATRRGKRLGSPRRTTVRLRNRTDTARIVGRCNRTFAQSPASDKAFPLAAPRHAEFVSASMRDGRVLNGSKR
jgi:hypothetical protein